MGTNNGLAMTFVDVRVDLGKTNNTFPQSQLHDLYNER